MPFERRFGAANRSAAVFIRQSTGFYSSSALTSPFDFSTDQPKNGTVLVGLTGPFYNKRSKYRSMETRLNSKMACPVVSTSAFQVRNSCSVEGVGPLLTEKLSRLIDTLNIFPQFTSPTTVILPLTLIVASHDLDVVSQRHQLAEGCGVFLSSN